MIEHDIELTRTEAELLRQETTLQTELDRLEVTRLELADRLASLTRQVAEARAAGVSDAALEGRLAALPVAAPDGEGCRAMARAKRHEAVVARRRANAELEKLIGAWRREYGQAGAALLREEAAVQDVVARAARQALERDADARSKAAAASRVAPPPPPPPVERAGRAARINQRVPMQAAIDLHSDDNFFTGFSSNLSDGGVFVATVNLLPIGTEVDLSFSLPTGERIEAKGEVRWVREINVGDPEQSPGMGVQFTALPSEAEAAVHRFVRDREPLFYAAA